MPLQTSWDEKCIAHLCGAAQVCCMGVSHCWSTSTQVCTAKWVTASLSTLCYTFQHCVVIQLVIPMTHDSVSVWRFKLNKNAVVGKKWEPKHCFKTWWVCSTKFKTTTSSRVKTWQTSHVLLLWGRHTLHLFTCWVLLIHWFNFVSR